MPVSVASALTELGTALRGKRIWNASVGYGSFLTLDIGGQRTSSVGEHMGEFRLWVYGSQWAIGVAAQNLATSSADHDVMESAARKLVAKSVISASLEPDSVDLVIELEGSLSLRTTALKIPDMEEWMLYFGDGTVLVASSELSIESSSGPGRPEDAHWTPPL